MPWFLALVLGCAAAFRAASDGEPAANPSSIEFIRSELMAGLRTALIRAWRVEPKDLELALQGESILPEAATSDTTVRWAGIPPEPTSRFRPRCEFVRSGQVAATWVPLVQARCYREFWFADHPLAREAAFSASDLRRERSDVLSSPVIPWEGNPFVGEWMVTEVIRRGGMIPERAVKRRPVIFRGDIATANLVDGLLTVSFRVIAIEGGAVGERVRCHSTLNSTEFRAKIIDAKTLLVEH